MTVRSIILGLLGAAILCAVTFFNDMVLRGTYLVGNFIPVFVFGTLILVVLLVNPALALFSKKAVLSARELAVIAALVLFACYIPGRGLMHYFYTFLMMPNHWARHNPGWQGGPAHIEQTDIREWPALAAALKKCAGTPDHPFARAVRRLPAEFRAELTADVFTIGSQDRVLEALNAILKDPELARDPGVRDLQLPRYAEAVLREPAESRSAVQTELLNRGLLDALLPDALLPRLPAELDNLPRQMLAETGDSDKALDGFVRSESDPDFSLLTIPWGAWRRALVFWVPLILTICVASVGLALVLHRQWASHEHLPYPTVEFARSLLPEEGQALSSIFRTRLFWLGAGLVLFIHMNNYAETWFKVFIRIPVQFNLTPLLKMMPLFNSGPAWLVFQPTLFFTAIGFAYFLASDVSLSLGLAPYIYCLVLGVLQRYGISLSGRTNLSGLSPESMLYAGAYTGVFLSLVYIGRRYYVNVLRRGLGLSAPDRVEAFAVWGARVFLLTSVLFVVQMALVGVEWQMSVLYWLGMMMIFVVISRLLVEAGVFFVHAWFVPSALLMAFLGARAAGPDQLLVLAAVSTLILIDPREAMMPFVISGIQLVDRTQGRIGATARWGVVALVVGFAAALPVTLYLHYKYGMSGSMDGWTTYLPTFPFEVDKAIRQRLGPEGLAEASAISGWRRFAEARPESKAAIIAFGSTFGLALLFMFLRHRFANWPFHPVMFLVLGTWQSANFAFSFLVGWFFKRTVTKYGGSRLYNRLRPFVIGLVAGEMLAILLPVVIGTVYYLVTGDVPKPFRLLPS